MNNRKTKYIVLIVSGIAALIGSFVMMAHHLTAVGGGLSGFGGAAIMLSVIKLCSEQNRIEDVDERNLMIQGKTAHIANLMTMAALTVRICYYIIWKRRGLWRPFRFWRYSAFRLCLC